MIFPKEKEGCIKSYAALLTPPPLHFSSLELRIHSQVIHDKAIDVRLFLQNFGHRLAFTVSGFAVDADNGRIRSVIAFLQGSGKFE